MLYMPLVVKSILSALLYSNLKIFSFARQRTKIDKVLQSMTHNATLSLKMSLQ